MDDKSTAYYNFKANYKLHEDTGLNSGDIVVVVAYFIVIIIVGVFVSKKSRCICSFLDIALYQSVRPCPSTPLTGYVQSQSTDGKRLFPGGKIYAMATREYTNCKNVSLSNITLYFRKE